MTALNVYLTISFYSTLAPCDVEYENVCFLLESIALNWYDAQVSCQNQGARLAEIDSAELNNALSSLLLSTF